MQKLPGRKIGQNFFIDFTPGNHVTNKKSIDFVDFFDFYKQTPSSCES